MREGVWMRMKECVVMDGEEEELDFEEQRALVRKESGLRGQLSVTARLFWLGSTK